MNKDLQELDENWITPAALARDLGTSVATVSNWIKRKKIAYKQLPGAIYRRYLVDRRTAPALGNKGGRPKNKKSQKG